MALATWLLARLRNFQDRAKRGARNGPTEFEALVRAHGDWIALLATILERERIVDGDELARSLREFSNITVVDRPAEGHILSFWATYLQDTSVALGDMPSTHRDAL